MTSHSTIHISAGVNASLDCEDYAAWSSLMYRPVDLEGIGEDGLGYTVNISGPPKPSKRGRRLRRKTSKDGEDERKKGEKSGDDSGEDRCSNAVEIFRKREYSVSSGPL
jgi:hypothetical protein